MASDRRLAELSGMIFDMSEDIFLTGPEGRGVIPDIDDIFATSWENARTDVLWDALLKDPVDIDAWARDIFEAGTVLAKIDGVSYLNAVSSDGLTEMGVIAYDPSQSDPLVGLYTGATLRVRDDMQGKGIGRTLVVERFLQYGDLPTWNLDVPAYSPAGEAAHRSAFRHLICDLYRSPETIEI